MRCLLGLFLLLSTSLLGADDTVTLMVDQDRSEMTIGSHLTVAVKVIHEASETLKEATFYDKWGDLELKDYVIYEPETLKDGRTLLRTDYVLSSYRLGEFSVPIESEMVHVWVKSILKEGDDLSQIRDIKGLVTIKKTYTWLLWLLLILFIAGLGAWLWRRYLQQQVLPEPEYVKQIPEDEEALAALIQLNAQAFEHKKDYYEALSLIVKRYLERRYEILAVESTTEEIYMDLKEAKLAREMIKDLDDLLKHADLVKFAKLDVDDRTCEASRAQAKKIVNQTRRPHRKEEDVSAS